MFVLLRRYRRAENRISVGAAILKKAMSMIIPSVKNMIIYSKGEDGAINPRGRFVCWEAIVSRHLGVTKGENMFLRRGVVFEQVSYQ